MGKDGEEKEAQTTYMHCAIQNDAMQKKHWYVLSP
jgi:hypothetical protein